MTLPRYMNTLCRINCSYPKDKIDNGEFTYQEALELIGQYSRCKYQDQRSFKTDMGFLEKTLGEDVNDVLEYTDNFPDLRNFNYTVTITQFGMVYQLNLYENCNDKKCSIKLLDPDYEDSLYASTRIRYYDKPHSVLVLTVKYCHGSKYDIDYNLIRHS